MTSVKFYEDFPDQDTFAKAVLKAQHKNYIFAGDIRSGKTIICLVLLVLFCKAFPGSRWAVIRESRPKLLKTTIPTFFKYCCPSNFIRDFNKSELIFTAINNSQILFLSEQFEHDPGLTSFWGLEVNGFFLNQGDELQKEMYNMSVMRRGQWKISPMPPAFTLIDANPTDNWLKDTYDLFMRNELPSNTYFQLADMDKNPYITEEYKKDMKDTLPEDLYLRFCKNNWDVVNAIMQLVSWEDIRACFDLRKDDPVKRKFLGVDVGHDGPDPSVWTIMEGSNIIPSKTVKITKTKIPEVTRKTEQIMLEERIDAEDVCIDAVGLGAGVCDELEEKDHNVIKFKGGNACNQELTGTSFTFANLRAFSNWLAADEIRHHHIGGLQDNKLVSDAGSIRYTIKGDKSIYIRSKEEIKKKLKRSPDDWDSFTYANWARLQDIIRPMPGIFTV